TKSAEGASHALEQVRVAAAHLELLRPALDAHQLAPALVAADAGNGARVDQRGAVDLPELRRVERGNELPDRRADQRFLLRGLHAGVFLIGDEEQHLLDRDHLDLLADRGLDPSQMRRSLELAGQALERLLQSALRVVRRRGEALADALDGEGEP